MINVAGDQAEGLYEVSDAETWASNLPPFEVHGAFEEWAFGKVEPKDFGYLGVTIEIYRALIRQAIEDVGRENINGEALYNAFQQLENIETQGVFHDLGWGPERRIGNRFMKMKQYTKTGTVAVSDWIPMDDVFGKEGWGKEGWPAAD